MGIFSETKMDALTTAKELAAQFAVDAKERDRQAGTPKKQKDLIRQSGLLKLLIPKEYGGSGESWYTVLQIVREFAKVDGSLAHLFGYHTLFIADVLMYGTKEQQKRFLTDTAENNYFWGNSCNPLDHRLFGKVEDGKIILNGPKSFSTGSTDSQYLLIAWEQKGDSPSLVRFGVIPSNREGVEIIDDWNGMGQRQTGSGTVEFHNVEVFEDEILLGDYVTGAPFTTLEATFAQSVHLNVFTGIAEGALLEAKQYTLTKSKPWYTSGYERAIDDPYIQSKYGYYVIRLKSAQALADQAAKIASDSFDKNLELTIEERGEVAVIVAAANVLTGEVAVEIANGIFELMGARSAAYQNNFDRYWRNVRTQTLHNPAEYKKRTLGNWFLDNQYPIPGGYA
ncbi:acyl-CoA dehydrogenase family protein [Rummeliibacillus suwonensis]|uniref:acyl-CoA dehydrogenase family protein n=1 Tax=Rummeliibacillus suwonensis TaxID=1306154 RepID=UPI0011B644C7|nr:acyl-CoA dehydrogenase family protein [Rummeliibacillus suwonensis]